MGGVEILLVALKADAVAPVPFDKAVRPGAHRALAEIIACGDALAGQDVDAGQVAEHHGVGAVGGDFHRARIHRLHIGPKGGVILCGGEGPGIFHGSLHILGIQGAAVLEQHALLQGEQPFRFTGVLIGGGQIQLGLQRLGVRFHQGVEGQAVHVARRHRLMVKRVQGGRLAFRADHKGIAHFGGGFVGAHAFALHGAFLGGGSFGASGEYAQQANDHQHQPHHPFCFCFHHIRLFLFHFSAPSHRGDAGLRNSSL